MARLRSDAVSLQFYNEVAPLVDELGRAMSVALDQGHAAVCVVTDSTRRLLEEHMTRRGIDVDDSRQRGQYVYLDGVDVLSKITTDGRPDPARFHDVVGRPVVGLARDFRGVWMYGELAAILWMQGHERGAIELERLWSSFVDAQPVVLCVAFPVDALSLPIVVDALKQSVVEHIRILAKGSSIGLAILRGPQDMFGGPRD